MRVKLFFNEIKFEKKKKQNNFMCVLIKKKFRINFN